MNGFTDLLHKCTHGLKAPVGLQNLFIEDSGIRLYFKGLVFGEIREDYSHDETEAIYIVNFSQVMLELITADSEFNDFANLSIDLSLKCILEECTKAYNRYKNIRDEENQAEAKKNNKDKTTARKLDTEINRIQEFRKAPEKKTRLPLVEMAQKGSLNDHLTFLRLQSHPYFSGQGEGEVDLSVVMEEYERLFEVNK